MIQPSKGTTRDTRNRGGVAFSLVLLVTAGAIATIGLLSFKRLTKADPLSPLFFEQEAPVLSWKNVPKGLGAEVVHLELEASDAKAGLDQVLVRAIQGNQAQILYKKDFPTANLRHHKALITLSAKDAKLKEGIVEIQAVAFDKALWNNGGKATQKLEVNFHKPHISVITPQQNGIHGGAEIVFYKITGREPESHGIRSEGSFYPGFSAAGWGPAFSSRPSIHLALYPIPQSLNPKSTKMLIQARDSLGNTVTSKFPHRTRRRRWRSQRSRLTNSELQAIIRNLRQYAGQNAIHIDSAATTAADLKQLVAKLSINDDNLLSSLLANPIAERLWSEYFLIPVRVSPSNQTGDLRLIYLGTDQILKIREAGVRFTVSTPSSVVASNSGKVIYTGQLGLLGNTIIIDHGLGLTTLYSHLSNFSVTKGRSVTRGDVIGTTGRSGFSTANELYYQVRIHGIPVSPREWWDKRWISEHIDEKIAFVLRSSP